MVQSFMEGPTMPAPVLYLSHGAPPLADDAPAAPGLADEVTKLLTAPGQTSSSAVHRDESRGLDHGAYVPLKEMFPDADVPVLQMSMPTLDPRALFRLGQKLAP